MSTTHKIRMTGLSDHELDAHRSLKRFLAHVAGLVGASVVLDDAGFAAMQQQGGSDQTAATIAVTAPAWIAAVLERSSEEEANELSSFSNVVAHASSHIMTDDLSSPTADQVQHGSNDCAIDLRGVSSAAPAPQTAVGCVPYAILGITTRHVVALTPVDTTDAPEMIRRAVARVLSPRAQGIAALVEALIPPVDAANAYPYAEPSAKQGAPSTGIASDEVARRVNAITRLFEETMLKRRPDSRAADDSWCRGGRENFAASVERYVASNARILFVLPAFPFKSSNRDTKVLGTLPDMGEYLALRRLDSFLGEVEAIHPPGSRLICFSDGRVYCDHFRIPDETTSTFKSTVRTLYSSPRIVWSDLDMFYPGLSDDEKRVELEGLFGASEAVVARRIVEDADFTEVYCGFKKFMTEELSVQKAVLPESPSKKLTAKQVRTLLSGVARRLMIRNYAYGAFVQMLFPVHVRLSIHPSTNTRKFSLNLLGSSDWGTPWHNCALLSPDGTRWSLIRKGVAEERGCVLVTPKTLDWTQPWATTATPEVVQWIKEAPQHLPFYIAQDEATVTAASPWESMASSPTGVSAASSPHGIPQAGDGYAPEVSAPGGASVSSSDSSLDIPAERKSGRLNQEMP